MKFKVGILGATGTVGQRFIQLLSNHPLFEISTLSASSKSQNQSYVIATTWKLDTKIPPHIKDLQIVPCEPSYFSECDIIFSALDSSVAGQIEESFMSEFPVFSNAKNHRMGNNPLVVPLANPHHLFLNSGKGIITNANCSTTGLVVVLKALEKFNIQFVNVVTMQAISGAGYPGVPSLDILGNVVPFIDGEEEKIETESRKIMGKYENGFVFADFVVDATCNRVPVINGHTECVEIKFKQRPKLEELRDALANYRVREVEDLFYKPENVITVCDGVDRPQPLLDLGDGFGVVVGRLRQGNFWDLELTLLSHNTVLGAAGSSIMNAEMCIKKGLINTKH